MKLDTLHFSIQKLVLSFPLSQVGADFIAERSLLRSYNLHHLQLTPHLFDPFPSLRPFSSPLPTTNESTFSIYEP